MDRRELLKTLTGGVAGIPAVKSIELLELKPGDTLVLTYPGDISSETANRIRAFMEEKFPGHKAMVIGDGGELKVLRNS